MTNGKERVTEYIEPDEVTRAIALYNEVRTVLEEAGWNPTPGFWWVHPEHGGTHTMAVAYGQWRLDVEADKR